MKKQTAVEWYENEIDVLFEKYDNKEISKSEFLIMKHNLFYQAKEIFKEQMKDAWIDDRFPLDKDWVKQCAEQYYNETFNTNEK